MKKYLITRFAAGNIANLGSVSFTSEGEDVTITGQNGTGKSTVKKAITWILAGSTSDGEKLIPYDNAAMPFAELELYDGVGYVTFRKEMVENRDNEGKISRTARCYIQGLNATQKDFQDYFKCIIPTEVFKLMINLFGFTSLKPAEQRALLVKYFGNVTDKAVMESDETLQGLNFGTFTPEKFIESTKKEILRLKKSAEKIALEIEFLKKETVDTSADEEERAAINEQIKQFEVELNRQNETLKNYRDTMSRAQELNTKLYKVQAEQRAVATEINSMGKRLNDLRRQWVSKANCPTCGQKLSAEKVKEINAKVMAEGKPLREKYEKKQNRLKELTDAEESLIEEIESHKNETDEINAVIQIRDNIQSELNRLKNLLRDLDRKAKFNEESLKKIEKLRENARLTGSELTENERKISLAETFIRRKMELVSAAINAKFKRVKFKMFETSKSGEVSNTCEAMLNGVPYAYLSKGEKFTAALDILGAFQKHFDAALPLIVDDAESYTSQTIADFESLSNQKILLKVADGEELKISVESVIERRRTA